MSRIEQLSAELRARPRRWLVTGAAGFIGSNLLEALLKLGQIVVGLDNFATGHRRNLEDVKDRVGPEHWRQLTFVEGDVRDLTVCRQVMGGVQHVLHQGALGSVPRSLTDPVSSNEANVSGTLNIFVAAWEAGVESLVYASSSSVYGDSTHLPKVENVIGSPLSPYAVTKRVNELYAEVFAGCYRTASAGLRYFNVFGPRQDPNGAYAAVIPRWIQALLDGQQCTIYGDGETSRDFCYVSNVVQANLLAATQKVTPGVHQVYNIAVGEQMNLRQLHSRICAALASLGVEISHPEPLFADFRAGDIRHSLADISRAVQNLGYSPEVRAAQGLELTVEWYLASKRRQ